MTNVGWLNRSRLLLWGIRQWWRISRAWGRKDWQAMIPLLREMIDTDFRADSDYILLGLALARLGRFPEALWYFERVTDSGLSPIEQSFYFNQYAYALTRTDQAMKAAHLLCGTKRDQWPASQRDWADKFLASRSAQIAPPLEGMTPRVLHS